jgi:hypothetical protein
MQQLALLPRLFMEKTLDLDNLRQLSGASFRNRTSWPIALSEKKRKVSNKMDSKGLWPNGMTTYGNRS